MTGGTDFGRYASSSKSLLVLFRLGCISSRDGEYSHDALVIARPTATRQKIARWIRGASRP